MAFRRFGLSLTFKGLVHCQKCCMDVDRKFKPTENYLVIIISLSIRIVSQIVNSRIASHDEIKLNFLKIVVIFTINKAKKLIKFQNYF